ncbi:MAG: transcription termination/antitermination protein NusG [Clostridia bacterium]|nr:transcription termination/antitermination protein NusG [Clostridia bacterium]MCI8979458.1 transcription termination/antitermination protein NusG [Clostridia bacterium]MCI9086078.1 transcription termination/antitermination protein NusG [Clostridia bacterium]NDO19147.1 transcription termination/antitermination protein NusG [Lachnospiraceae bacterium MD329]
MAEDAKWYVAHTYSGYENKVKDNIEKTVENRGMQDLILDVRVPTEDVIEEKGDEKKVVKRKIFPGYVVIKMVLTDESWYVVRNTRGVTGFVGPGSKAVPLSDAEVERMGVEIIRMKDIDFDIGDNVSIKSGPMEGFSGKVTSINNETRKINVAVSMFGRETPVEIDYTQVEHME